MSTPTQSTAPSIFNWAVIGPGKIAHRFTEAVARLPGSRLHAVHGRDAGRAAAFASTWSEAGKGRPARVVPDLAELLADPQLDGVYIATPHAQHVEAARACLAAGKPMLCEKPLVPTLALGRELVALSRERGVFLMEAVWTRFLPVYADVIGPWLRAGEIGALRGLQSSFCFPATHYGAEHRCFNPALAGGALLDIGIYNLTVTRWVLEQMFGSCPEPEAIIANGVLAPTGVDQRVNATLLFAGGLASQFICGFDSASDNALHIMGERGSITVPRSFSAGQEARLYRHGVAEPESVRQAPWRINGFEGEIEEAEACIRAGRIESAVMPLAETLATLAWMDQIRGQLGVRYPFEG